MKRRLLALVTVVTAVIVVVVVVAEHRSPSADSRSMVSHTIQATAADMADLKDAFLTYKLQNKEMLSTDKIVWGQIISPNGPNRPAVAYDAVDHREWAIAGFNLVLPASYKAEVSFQDGGSMGIFNKIGSGKWFMTGSPGLPLCPKDVPSVVARLWGLKNYPACD
jgi:hypothetical protein